MLQSVPIKPTTKQRFVLRRRFELLGALFLAAIVPWAGFRWLITDTTFDAAVFHNSLIANAVAIFLALWMRLSVETYPGIRAGQTIFPAVLVAHALTFGALLMM